MEQVILRQRMGYHDAHYGGQLVDGARMLALFGDAATELLIRHDGDEGLFAGYETVEFKTPVYAGDYIEVHAKLIRIGNTSRTMEFHAYKVIRANVDPALPSAADVADPPELVCWAKGTCVVPKALQRVTR